MSTGGCGAQAGTANALPTLCPVGGNGLPACVVATNGVPNWVPAGDQTPIAYDPVSGIFWVYSCVEGIGWRGIDVNLCRLSPVDIDVLQAVCAELKIPVSYSVDGECVSGNIPLSKLAEKLQGCMSIPVIPEAVVPSIVLPGVGGGIGVVESVGADGGKVFTVRSTAPAGVVGLKDIRVEADADGGGFSVVEVKDDNSEESTHVDFPATAAGVNGVKDIRLIASNLGVTIVEVKDDDSEEVDAIDFPNSVINLTVTAAGDGYDLVERFLDGSEETSHISVGGGVVVDAPKYLAKPVYPVVNITKPADMALGNVEVSNVNYSNTTGRPVMLTFKCFVEVTVKVLPNTAYYSARNIRFLTGKDGFTKRAFSMSVSGSNNSPDPAFIVRGELVTYQTIVRDDHDIDVHNFFNISQGNGMHDVGIDEYYLNQTDHRCKVYKL